MTIRTHNLNSTVRTLVLAGMVGTFFFGAATAKDIYMGGKSPYPTMMSALAAARALPAGETRRILVHGGAYYDTQVQLTAADSGLTIENVPGETPVFYGGDLVTGWETEGKFQVARILEASAGKGLAPRLLLVNGESRPRARFPATNTLTHETRFSVPWMSTTGGGWQRRPTHEELTTLQYRAGDLGDWLVTTNVEITVFHMWDESCVGVAGHDSARRVLTLAPATGHPPGAFGVQKYVLWNIKEGMTGPGQWYHDRARQRLVYWPRPGEDMRRVAVVAPSRAVLFSIRGTRQQPARGITLRGLTFSATTVPLVAGGFAAAKFDGAVSLSQAEDCVLERLTIKGVAGHGINGDGLRNVRVENCDISDCGAGGVYAGGTKVVIRNNHISKVGRSYPSAVGIFRGGSECLVSHNEVHDCTYSAINFGGRSNIIEGNLIYDCMKVLHDGAAIYMFGAKNSVLRGNLARDFKDHGGYGASAYYLDEQCSDCVVEGNVSLRVSWPSHNHMATNNIIRDNLFVVEGDAKITFPRSTGYTFARNVLYATGKIRFEGTNAVATWTDNLLYSGKGQIECVTQNRYSAVKTVTNAPPNSVVADPEFVNFARGDFRYRPGSPALKLSLRPVDASSAGRLPK
ncbi:MAG: right-handed parallel beta-helix repeat-containing protein [Verrucomicrobiota bacterium]